MKKFLSFLFIVPCLFLESCSDDFDINAPHEEVYTLNCILRNNSSIQYAVISKNLYSENGTTPTSPNADQDIKGAIVRIFCNDSVFVMRDTTVLIDGTQVNCYYIKDLTIRPSKDVRIEAAITNGQVLKSTIRLPEISYKNISSDFPKLYLSGYHKKPNYSWDWLDSSDANKIVLSLPQLEIYYKKYEEGTLIDKKILVPLAFYYFYDKNRTLQPVPVDFSFNYYCLTTLETINKTMQEISGDDPYKRNYIINKAVFSVICIDSKLSKFCSAYKVYNDDFTIKLRQTDVSNVEGGKGIFGAYYKFSKSLTIDKFYVESFGYKFDPL